eukprot:SAG22_NODE_7074_length_778_cov_3.257353_1_plen_64_part_00
MSSPALMSFDSGGMQSLPSYNSMEQLLDDFENDETFEDPAQQQGAGGAGGGGQRAADGATDGS